MGVMHRIWLGQLLSLLVAAKDCLKLHSMNSLPQVVVCIDTLLRHAICFMGQPCMCWHTVS